MNRRLDPPFLEVGLYFADITDADAFAAVARAILARGSRFLAAEGWRGPGKRTQPFVWKRGGELSEPLSISADQLPRALADPNLRITEVYFDHIIGISKAPERLEYLSVFSEEAARLDRHPIVILAEGEPFSGPHDPERGRKPGKKIYEVFRELVIALAPSYACITVERDTHCPTDLRQDPRHFAEDFFVNKNFIDSNGMAAIAKWFDGAYQEPMGDGLYVSTYKYWNPGGAEMHYLKSERLATEVGKLIGQRRPVRA